MEQRLSLVTLGVRSVAEARGFYERLGWKASSASSDEIAFFQIGGIAFGLYGREALAADMSVPDAGSGFSGFALAYNVPEKYDVDAVLREAENAGATLLKAAEDAFWGGRSGYFADPDGHPWEVAWNLGFPLHADGTLSLPE